MYGCLFLLALLIIPSALQKETETVSQKLVKLGGWLERWRDESQSNQVKITDNQDDLEDTLNKVVAEAAGVKAQLEELLVDSELCQSGKFR